MKQLITLLLLSFALLSNAAVTKATLTDSVTVAISNTTTKVLTEKVMAGVTLTNVNSGISNIIKTVTQDQLVYLLKTGQGRYLQTVKGTTNIVDGYELTYAVDEFLGPRGVGYVFRFYLHKDGKTWMLTKGQGPGYLAGTEGGWVEVVAMTKP